MTVMGLFSNNKIKKGAVADVIQCDLRDYIVWKWAPDSEDSGGLRANAIRYGSTLNVRAGETAAFFYNQSDGRMVEYVKGPVMNMKVETANLPVLSSIIGAGYGGGSPFNASVYFINTSASNQVPFFIDNFDVLDCFTEFTLPATLKGKVMFRIPDCERFFEVFSMNDMDSFEVKDRIKEDIFELLKSKVGTASSALNIPVTQLRANADKIKRLAFDELKDIFYEKYAIELLNLNIESINIDTEHENYGLIKARMSEIGAKALDIAKAERFREAEIANAQSTRAADEAWTTTAASTRNRTLAENEIVAARLEREKMMRMNDITLDNLEDTLRRQREESQRASRLSTETGHLAAHQVDVQGAVAHRAAESLGELGASGGASMGGDGGMNVAGMMTGMMMGSAVGQNMANMMGNMTQNIAQPGPPVPPPGATVQFFVAVNGQQTGPYNMIQMTNMITAGQVTRQTYVWKQGMAGWDFAGNVPELAQAFGMTPPPLPPQNPPVPPAM